MLYSYSIFTNLGGFCEVITPQCLVVVSSRETSIMALHNTFIIYCFIVYLFELMTSHNVLLSRQTIHVSIYQAERQK